MPNNILNDADQIKAIIASTRGDPTKKLIALLRALGVTSTTEIAFISDLTPRAIQMAIKRVPRAMRPDYKKRPIHQSLRWSVFERDMFRCKKCGTHKGLSCDHIVPESKGGATAIDNLQTLCGPCNSSKGARV